MAHVLDKSNVCHVCQVTYIIKSAGCMLRLGCCPKYIANRSNCHNQGNDPRSTAIHAYNKSDTNGMLSIITHIETITIINRTIVYILYRFCLKRSFGAMPCHKKSTNPPAVCAKMVTGWREGSVAILW